MLIFSHTRPVDNPPNDVVNTGLYLQEYDPVALTSSVRAVQTGNEWDPSDMFDNIEVSRDGKLIYMFANWVDSNEWNSGIEALIQANLLQSTALPSTNKRSAPLAQNREEDFVVEYNPEEEADWSASQEAALETEEAESESRKRETELEQGPGVVVHKLNLHIPGMAAPGHFYNPPYARAQARLQQQQQQEAAAASKPFTPGFKGTHVIDNQHSTEPGKRREKSRDILQALSQRCTIAPYLVTMDSTTFKTVAVLDMGELFCEGLAHYLNPCNGLGLGGKVPGLSK